MDDLIATSRQGDERRYGVDELKAIMTRLRDPEGGCPWDQKQNFKSISPYTIEEAYEVVDAIDSQDMAALCDELGDLLFQVIYHAELAREDGCFDFDDVVHAISAKLIRRHPHVFGDETLRSDEEIREMWERVKREEKAGANPPAGSILDDVPVGLPGLTRAVKLQKKAARVGFDWGAVGPVMDKLEEELAELREAMAADSGLNAAAPGGEDGKAKAGDKVTEEFGDLLFVMANLARHMRIDPEDAIRRANGKFCSRFGYIEETLREAGGTLEAASLDEMEALWDDAKGLERE